MKIKLLLVSCLSVLVSACDPGLPSDGMAAAHSVTVKGYAEPLTASQFDKLPPLQQYQVANKLLSTLYKGVSVDEFFDLSAGLGQPRVKDSVNFIQGLRVRLATDLDPAQKKQLDSIIIGDPDAVDAAGAPAPLDAKYDFDDSRPKQMPLARIFDYPVSRDAYVQWMALHLTNTILFSPAEEIDSADITDVQNLYRRLDISIMSGASVRSIVATHQRSIENWRRFRSPEDNTREMIEIYLGLFDRDADVPRAAEACRDLYLTDEASGYKLAYTDFPNDQPQLVLGSYVLNCNEFYDVIAAHPLLIPRVTSVLVDYFFDGRSVEDRLKLVESISASEPQTFEDIFTAILFSREYLLNTERPKSFEENFLSAAAKVNWQSRSDIFYGMTTGRGGAGRTELAEMGWPTMTLKLGRLAGIPLDSLSFANYHKGLRETLLLDKYHWGESMGLIRPDGPQPEPPEPPVTDADEQEKAAYREALATYNEEIAAMTPAEKALYDEELAAWQETMQVYERVDTLSLDDLIDYVFVSIAERRASATERQALIDIMDEAGHLETIDNQRFALAWRKHELATVVMDYLSRLPEIYYFKRHVQG
ncbi:MAG: hypothetical protein KDJ38_00365 [Gammaproteobacteria bacterium]|nr:hypothetical protein [Gammaproteobacteria bacterium]